MANKNKYSSSVFSATSIKVGINGFGRIGRAIFRLNQTTKMGKNQKHLNQTGYEKGAAFADFPPYKVDKKHEISNKTSIDIAAVNSRSSIEMSAHLLKYDSVHGVFEKPVTVTGQSLWVGGQESAYSSYKHPSEIPWDKWGVKWVLECSGAFKTREDLEGHMKPTVQRIFVSAPLKNADFTLVYGVNHKKFHPEKHKIISNSSCTTNCLAPVIKVLDENFGLKELMFTTIHSYTQDQKLLDSAHKKDFRRARSAGLSMIPTTTGAEDALALVFPHLKDRVKGMAVRVPTANVSLVDMVCRLQKSARAEEINQAFKVSAEGDLKGVLGIEEQELVSVDFNGCPLSAVVDGPSTAVTSTGLVKVLAWYDNEIGFSQRMLDFIFRSPP